MQPTTVVQTQAGTLESSRRANAPAIALSALVGGWLVPRVALFKPRVLGLALLVVTIAGLTAVQGAADFGRLFLTLVGTTLLAGAGLVVNQVLEQDVDLLMARTRSRPLPSRRVSTREAWIWATVMACSGTLWFLGWGLYLAMYLCVLSVGVYVFVYTPLKRLTPLNTVVGAVSGAMPPLIGRAGVTGELDAVAWVLFGILFFWQFPHFFAIAWLWRDEYKRAGLKMLTADDPVGWLTGRLAFLYALPLWPLSLSLARVADVSAAYLVGASLANVAFLGCCLEFWSDPSERTARQLLRASVLYIPALLGLMMLEFAV